LASIGFAAEGTDTAAREQSEADQVERALIRTGNRLLEQGKLREAEEMYRRALQRNPQSRAARIGLGNVLIRSGRDREARKLLEPMLSEFPDDFTLKNNVAWLLAVTPDATVKDGRRAVELAQEALLHAPRDYHVWSTLAEAHFACGEYERALKAAEQALSLAREKRAPASEVKFYRAQVEKCRRAVEVFSLVE